MIGRRPGARNETRRTILDAALERVRAAFAPRTLRGRRVRSPLLIVLAAFGASLLLIVAATDWQHLNDEYAYWLAGTRILAGQTPYDVTAAANTPYAYWYPPPLAELLAPLTTFMSADAFSVLWTALLLGCLWWLAGRKVITALALVAFLPVAVELRVRNVHLILAVLYVLALRLSPLFWVAATALKITPVLSLAYLAAAERWRAFFTVCAAGLAALGVSFVLAPWAWRAFLEVVGARADSEGGALLPIPFAARFAVGAALAFVAGRLTLRAAAAGEQPRVGEALLIVALTIANPTLWVTALSLLIAIVPLWRTAPARLQRMPPARLRRTPQAPALAVQTGDPAVILG